MAEPFQVAKLFLPPADDDRGRYRGAAPCDSMIGRYLTETPSARNGYGTDLNPNRILFLRLSMLMLIHVVDLSAPCTLRHVGPDSGKVRTEQTRPEIRVP